MKKWFCSIFILVGLLALPLAAQVSFGIAPGAQYSSGRQHPLSLAYDRTYRCTAVGNIWLNIPLFWKVSVRPGLMYSAKEFNATVVYSGPEHLTTPATVKNYYIEMPALIIIQPVDFFHLGAGGYIAQSVSRELYYTPLIQTTTQHSNKLMCCPPPPPKPKPLGCQVAKLASFDYGYVLAFGFDWNIKCPSWTIRNSIEFTFSRGAAKVFQTLGRFYVNEAFTASYILWF